MDNFTQSNFSFFLMSDPNFPRVLKAFSKGLEPSLPVSDFIYCLRVPSARPPVSGLIPAYAGPTLRLFVWEAKRGTLRFQARRRFYSNVLLRMWRLAKGPHGAEGGHLGETEGTWGHLPQHLLAIGSNLLL